MNSYTIPSMIIRIGALFALILGVSFWTGHLDNLVYVHMILGILVVLSVWWLGIALLRSPQRNVGLAVTAFALGALLWLVGITQANIVPTNHWIIQVTHLALALLTLGLGETIAARLKKGSAPQAA